RGGRRRDYRSGSGRGATCAPSRRTSATYGTRRQEARCRKIYNLEKATVGDTVDHLTLLTTILSGFFSSGQPLANKFRPADFLPVLFRHAPQPHRNNYLI